MPLNKSAHLRYRIIDSCLTNPLRRYPTMEFIIEKIEEQTGHAISESMFSKDIQAMKQEYNAPIKYSRTNEGYYYTEDEFSIKEFPLTHEEIEILDFSTALLGQLKGSRLFQQYENAINKVIEGYRISKIPGMEGKQFLQTEVAINHDEVQWLELLLKAIIQQKTVKVVYQSYGGEAKTHELSPYLLKEYRNRWYVIGYSDRIQNTLVLALDRIQSATLSKGLYYKDRDFNSAEFFKYSIGITQVHGLEPEEVILSFTPFQAQYILSQPLHHSQEVILENDKEVRIKLTVYITQELKMAVLAFGAEVKVIQPKSFKQAIVDSAKKVLKNYQ